MSLTLVDRSIAYQYRVLEYVLMKVDDLLFPTNFVIFDMPKDFETLLLIGRSFLAASRALIDMELGELIIRFNKEKSCV